MDILNTPRTGKNNRESARLTNIKVPKDVADLIRIYCIFNNKKVTDYATKLFEKDLLEFKENLAIMRKLRT